MKHSKGECPNADPDSDALCPVCHKCPEEECALEIGHSGFHWSQDDLPREKATAHEKDECEHDLENAVRKGRAKYYCPKCDADVSLEWFYYMQAVMETEAGEKDDWQSRFDAKFSDTGTTSKSLLKLHVKAFIASELQRQEVEHAIRCADNEQRIREEIAKAVVMQSFRPKSPNEDMGDYLNRKGGYNYGIKDVLAVIRGKEV